MKSSVKHLIHCSLFLSIIVLLIYGSNQNAAKRDHSNVDPWLMYGFIPSILLYLIRFLTLLVLPQVIFNFCGLVLYNAFPERVALKGSPLLAPFICFRVVTRGDFPDLVKANVLRNMNACLDAGLENFQFEVVTDKAIQLMAHRRMREIVVPIDYRPKGGGLFKSRALQYCLEDSVNVLNGQDWIVHLDEETLLTDNSIRGITNFVFDGKYPFGQGLITYANENVVNWFTTLADSFRVSDDMGKLRFQFKMFHKPLFSWKGSYVVTQVSAERAVSFDNGTDGSVAEDCFFAMKAFSKGYSFNFIDGEMYEKSPFTIWDFIQQRKRWLQGILLVVHSRQIPFKYKIFLTMSLYSWVTMPLTTCNILLAVLYPLPRLTYVDYICAFIGAVNLYMYIFGVIKSFSLYRFGCLRFICCLVGAVCTIPLNIIVENVAVIWGLVTEKHKFYVVQKNIQTDGLMTTVTV